MMKRFALAWAAVSLVVLSALSLGVSIPDTQQSWVEVEQAQWTRQLEHAAPGSPEAMRATRKLARLESAQDGRPTAGYPDEYMRFLSESRIPSDRTTSEYEPGYAIRELKRAKAARRAPAVILPWQNRGPGNVAGRARAIAVDPSDPTGDTWLIAAVGGGIWKTTDQGTTWGNLTENVPTMQMQSLVISPSNPQVIYAGTGESYYNVDTLNGNGILKSTDGGATWAPLASTVDDYRFNNVSRIIVDPADENLVLASTTVGTYKASLQPTSHIFRSTDGGVSWTEVHQETGTNTFSGPRILQLVADPANFDNQYAAVYGAGILKSTDGGLNWAFSNNGITDFTGRFEMAISPLNSNLLFASAMGDDAGTAISRLWHSIDGGANWIGGTETKTSSTWLGGQGWYDNTIVCSPVDTKVVYVGGIRLWKLTLSAVGSTGYSASLLSTGGVHVDNHGLAIVQPSGGGWYILNTNDGGVGFSSSGDTGWSAPIAGLTTTQFYGVDKRPGASAYIGGMQDNGTWMSPINSAQLDNWTFAIGGDGYETSWHFNDPQRIIGGYQFNGLMRSLDGGATWLDGTSGLTDFDSGNAPFITKIGKSNARPDVLFAVGVSGPWRSPDFGGSWSLSTLNGGNWGSISSFHNVRVSEANPDVVWAGSRMDGSGDIYVSTDDGLNFDPVTQYATVSMGRISGMATHPAEPGTAYLLFSFAQRPKVLKTTDFGVTWTDISGFDAGTVSTNGFPDVAVYDLVVFPNDNNRIWVGSEIGLIESLDGGATWALADTGLPSVAVWHLEIQEDEVVVASHGRGIWSVTMPELETGLTFSPLLEQVAQSPDGLLHVEGNLRSAADSTQIFIDGSVVETIGPNAAKDPLSRTYPVMSAGLRTVMLRSYKAGTPYDSISKSTEVFLFAAAVGQYTNDLSTTADFSLQNGFIYDTPAGFSNQALHSPHPYLDSSSPIATLMQPILVAGSTSLNFDEVVIVEPGEPGSVFGDADFWDYVITEGTIDGVNWVPLASGYDARDDAAWLSAYNSGSSGNSTMFRSRQILLNDTFNKADVILIRFRLLADGFVNGWGWAIDNVNVDSGTPTASPSRPQFALGQNFPNPFNPQTRIEFELPRATRAKLQIFDLRGRLVRTLINGERQAGPQSVTWSGRDGRGAQVASGVYVYRLVADGQILQNKMTLVK